MLVAVDLDGRPIDAELAEIGSRHFCPECGDELVHRAGTYITANFAHPADPLGTCALRSTPGESYEHQAAKEVLTGAMREVGYLVEVETTLHDDWDRRRPDLSVYSKTGDLVAIEVQHSSITVTEKNDRNAAHRRLGAIGTIWVWIRAPQFHFSGTADLQVAVYDEWRRTRVLPCLYGRTIQESPRGLVERLALRLLDLSDKDNEGNFVTPPRCGIRLIPAVPRIGIGSDLHGDPMPRFFGDPAFGYHELPNFASSFEPGGLSE